jgi:hypothetical protein
VYPEHQPTGRLEQEEEEVYGEGRGILGGRGEGERDPCELGQGRGQ